MRALPDLPPSVGPLTDDDFNRLRRQYPDLWVDPSQSCLICKKTGEFTSREGPTKCDCVGQWLLYCHLLNAGVDRAYQGLDWYDLDEQVTRQPEVMKSVRAYAEKADIFAENGIGMILWGPNGTGKTLLATLLLKRLIAQGWDGYFVQFSELLAAYTATWRNEDERQWFVRRIRNAGVLVVDDIGKEAKGRENVTGSMFDDVIRHRVSAMKPTIITTNYTMEKMQAGYGGSVMSLLAERCVDKEVTGADFRQQKRAWVIEEAKARITRPITLGTYEVVEG